MKNYLFLIFGFLFLISCNVLKKNNPSALNKNDTKIISLKFDTSGGGDIQFKISPANNEYKINITRYQFASVIREINVSKNTNTELHELLNKIFSKEIDIRNEVYEPGGSTGTWTSVTVNYDTQEAVEIPNIDVNNRLKLLYNYIRN
jgi:preprotein translocase subunit SecD